MARAARERIAATPSRYHTASPASRTIDECSSAGALGSSFHVRASRHGRPTTNAQWLRRGLRPRRSPAQEDQSPMHDQRSYSIPHERRRRVEAAVLALVLAEDWPWRVGELAQRLRLPADVIGLGTATLRADGLLVVAHARQSCARRGRRCAATNSALPPRANSIKRPALSTVQRRATSRYRHSVSGERPATTPPKARPHEAQQERSPARPCARD